MPLPRVHIASVAIFLIAIALALAGAEGDALWQLRAPRVAAGALVGALLALSGLALQVLLRNPLADPYVLGASAGAALGAIAALLLGVAIALGATVGALAAGALLMLLSSKALASLGSHADDAGTRLILTGAMLSAGLGALATLLLTLTPDGALRGAVFWLVGDLSGAQPTLWATGLLALALVLLTLFARAVDRLMLGSEAAHLLGEPVRALRAALVLGACLCTAAAVAMAGSIGFVGLVAPQALRLVGIRHTRALAWHSALVGAALVMLADTLARRVAYPLELPVGAVMSTLGAPLFVWFLVRARL
jgi:iron complex transport system permease protein